MAEPLRWRHTSGAQIWHRRTICEPNGSSMTPRWRQPDSKSRSRSQRTAGRTCAAVCEESPNIYPTFTYADDPARFVEGEATQQVFETNVGAYRERLWRQVEMVAGAPWFLGPRFSELDTYIAVMTRWRPRRGWFQAECLGTRSVLGLFTAWSRGLDLHRHKDRRNGGRASMEEAFSARIKRPGSFMRILS
jgi:hypothetical protein